MHPRAVRRATPLIASAVFALGGCSVVLETEVHRPVRMPVDGSVFDARTVDATTDRALDIVPPCDAPNGCCATDTDCTPPASCVSGACRVDCGAAGETCCEGRCSDGLPCRDDGTGTNWCAPCGTPGNVCCLGAEPCGAGLTCTDVAGVGYCTPLAPIVNTPGGSCTPLPATNCATACGVDPCGKFGRCEPIDDAGHGVCIACGLPGEPCCSGMLVGLPFYCPDITRCADQQQRTALCVPM